MRKHKRDTRDNLLKIDRQIDVIKLHRLNKGINNQRGEIEIKDRHM